MGDRPLLFEDYRLTTAEILYHSSGDSEALQTYVWQSLDRIPDFPKLNQFLDFWQNQLEGKLHSVRIAYVGEVEASELPGSDLTVALH